MDDHIEKNEGRSHKTKLKGFTIRARLNDGEDSTPYVRSFYVEARDKAAAREKVETELVGSGITIKWL